MLQGILVSILVGAGVVKTTDDGKNLQNFLICVEMLPAAFFMLFAFPYTEYKPSEGISLAFPNHPFPDWASKEVQGLCDGLYFISMPIFCLFDHTCNCAQLQRHHIARIRRGK